MKHLVCSISLLLIFCTAKSQQVTQFKNEADFLPKISILFDRVTDKKTKKFIEEFEKVWQSNVFGDKQKKQIIATSNQLLRRKARPVPDFTEYFKALMSFSNTIQGAQGDKLNTDYFEWEKGFVALLQDEKNSMKSINSYCEFLYLLQNDSIISKTPSTIWKVDSRNYVIRYNADKSQLQVEFSGSVNLRCTAKRDTSIIWNTNGKYIQTNRIWYGNNGKVTWQRAGLKKDDVFVDLYKYEIDMTKSEYKSDSVLFTNRIYVNQPLIGKFEEKLMGGASGDKAFYPKFISKKQDVFLKNVMQNVDYFGNFEQHGAKISGKATDSLSAYLVVYKNNELFMRVNAGQFHFDKKGVTAENAFVSIKINTDSIIHPSVFFKITKWKDYTEIVLARSEKGLSQAPFYNTYHKLEIEVPELAWKFNDSILTFRMQKGSSIIQTKFESSEYFSEDKYNSLQMYDKTNPLVLIKKYTNDSTVRSERFYLDAFSKYLKKPMYQVRHMLMRLSYQGFISFNSNTGEAIVLPRLFDYISAKVGKKDYDVISIISVQKFSTTNNAVLNLKNYDLDIYGVDTVIFSDTRRVSAKPKNKHVLVKQNRNIIFDGHVMAGLTDMYGKGFDFNYDNFNINTKFIDSLYFIARSDTVDKDSLYSAIKVISPIQKIRGTLQIDAIDNKSGIKKYFEYPSFTAHDTSRVFYNKAAKNDSIYSQKKFYFQAFPFKIDSLNSIKRNTIKIAGNLVSGGIFPIIGDTLTVQKDSSLGFEKKLPEKGLPLYKDKGSFHNMITLNSKGLGGNGEVRYITTTFKSTKIQFYPDSANCIAQEFDVKGQKKDSLNLPDSLKTEYPQLKGEKVVVRWLAKKDKLIAISKAKPFDLFDKKAILKGWIDVSKSGLKGNGIFTMLDSKLKSKNFLFGVNDLTSDTTNFSINPVTGKQVPVEIDNVKAHIDLNQRVGIFKSNGKISYIKFPVNKYICYMHHFLWNIDNRYLEIGTDISKYIDVKQMKDFGDTTISKTDTTYFANAQNKILALNKKNRKSYIDSADFSNKDAKSDTAIVADKNTKTNENTNDKKVVSQYTSQLNDSTISQIDSTYNERLRMAKQFPQSRFISVKKGQDSLSFNTGIAVFNIPDQVITAKTVDQIRVADAIIYPSGYVTIKPDAVMDPLSEAKIVVDTVSLYHTFRNARVLISGKKSYTAFGDYYYMDESGKGFTIHFTRISVDLLKQTIATGIINKKDSFRLSPVYRYYGDVFLEAKRKGLIFDGYTVLQHNCKQIGYKPIKFRTLIKPDSIYIPILNNYTPHKDQVYAGNFITIDSSHIYSVFLTEKHLISDSVVLRATGVLHYDKKSNYYIVADKEKVNRTDSLGYPGAYVKMHKNFCYVIGEGKIDYGPDFGALKITSTGKIINNTESNNITISSVFAVDFFFSPAIMQIMVDKIQANVSLEAIDWTKFEYKKNLYEFLGAQQSQKVFSEIETGYFSETPQRLIHTLTFTDVKFRWDSESHSYISVGKLGIGLIGKNMINKYVNGKIQIVKRKSGETINIYIETNENEWFYFTYAAPVLKCISSVEEFNTAIDKLKDKERKAEQKKGDEPFSYFTCEERAKTKFMSQFSSEDEYLKKIEDNDKITKDKSEKKK